jgi:hypothetical protein
MKNGLITAYARVKGYENQWKMMHAPGVMYGSNPDALAVMQAVPHMNVWTGRYHLPQGMELPANLQSAVPEASADDDAIEWAHDHMRDPRAKAILQHHQELESQGQ